MRTYELAYIAHPDLEESALEELEGRVGNWIASAGGSIEKVDRWGKRRLAYPIKKQNDGFYFIITVSLPPQGGTAIEREMRISEQILRYMITLNEPI